MKKILAIALVAVILLSVVGCSGSNTQVDINAAAGAGAGQTNLVHGDFIYAVNEDGNYEITGYTYTGAADKAVVIPDEIGGRPVTGIADSAFKSVSTMSAVTLPKSLEYISASAFYGCDILKSVEIPATVLSIGENAFWGCTSLEAVTFAENSALTEIGKYAFFGCTSLKKMSIASALTSVSDGAFYGCTSLTEVALPATVESIGASAFSGCNTLQKLTFAEGCVLKSIGTSAFSGCSALTGLLLPTTLEVIGENAFFRCAALTDIVVPASLKTVKNGAFSECANLEKVTFLGDKIDIGNDAKKVIDDKDPDNVITTYYPDPDARLFVNSAKVTVVAPASSTAAEYANIAGIAYEAPAAAN